MNYPYYAPYQRQMQGFYNPIVPQEQPNFQQPQYQQASAMPPAIQPGDTDMIWVLGENEASSYLVAPGRTVTMWDKNRDTIYLKSMSRQGVPSMRIFDYTERMPANAPKTPQNARETDGAVFAHADDLKAVQADLAALRAELDELKANQKEKKGKIAKSEGVENGEQVV